MFYKLIDEESKSLSEGCTVHSAEYMLIHELKDTYTYPVDGWYWFDSEEDAKAFFEISDESARTP